MKRIALLFLFLKVTLSSFAQESVPVEMASEMRASGKIYVVVAVLLIIFVGIVVYLIRLDKKIGRVENEKN